MVTCLTRTITIALHAFFLIRKTGECLKQGWPTDDGFGSIQLTVKKISVSEVHSHFFL